jgi:N-glycosylase/DNA lyase
MVLASVPAGFKALPLSVAHLTLPVVLKCGQSFRWSKVIDHDSQIEWRLTLSDRVVCLRQTPNTLYYRAVFAVEEHAARDNAHDTTLTWLKDYFQLEVDLVNLFSTVDDSVFQNALSRFEGAIRMLRQDPWETLISYALLIFPHSFILSDAKRLIDSSAHKTTTFPVLLAWFRISALISLRPF